LIQAMNARKKDAPYKKDTIDYYEDLQCRYDVEAFEKSLVTELRETNTYCVLLGQRGCFSLIRCAGIRP